MITQVEYVRITHVDAIRECPSCKQMVDAEEIAVIGICVECMNALYDIDL
jgi:hypothetical protein